MTQASPKPGRRLLTLTDRTLIMIDFQQPDRARSNLAYS